MQTSLALCYDQKFAPHAAVAAVSALRCSPNLFNSVCLLESNVTEKVSEKVVASIGKVWDGLIFRSSLAESYLSNLPTYGHLSAATHSRVFLPNVFHDFPHFLYLDSDCVVVSDLNAISPGLQLFDHEDAPLLAAVAARENRAISLHSVGLDSPSYFNAGVLLINANRWRRQNITEKYLSAIERFGVLFEHKNQDCMNLAVNGDWFELDSRANHQEPQFDPRAQVIHFVGGREKPWNFLTRHPYRGRYHEVRRQTAFRPYFPGHIGVGLIRLIFGMRPKELKKNTRKIARRISRLILFRRSR